MPLARSRLRIRRAELTHVHAPINLVPLVDILTAIVFFSLLSVITLRGALAAFDLVQAPAAPGAGTVATGAPGSSPELTARSEPGVGSTFTLELPLAGARVPANG